MHEVLVLNHHPETGPAGFQQVLDDRAGLVPWRPIDLPGGEPLPAALDEVAGVVVMGGPMSVTRRDDHAWMGGELAFLRRAVDGELPVLGICLGAQLLGVALGGEVAARRTPRAAFTAFRRTAAGTTDEVTAGWPDGAAALLFHEDEVVRYPDGAQPLLTGPEGEVAAWGVGSALAIQAHPEVTPDQLAGWLEDATLADLASRAGFDAVALLDEATRRERFSVPLGRALIGRFLDGPVRAAIG
jgi:GMP synthase (glutamine-hydrolysing)